MTSSHTRILVTGGSGRLGSELKAYFPTPGGSIASSIVEAMEPHHVLLYMNKVDRSGECWVWTGAKNKGYGYWAVWDKRRRRYVASYAHRVLYQLSGKAIPPEMGLDHLCRNRACVNPDHLEPVTCKENLNRSPLLPGARTCCKYGHPYTPGNTYLHVHRGKKARHCRMCAATRQRRRKAGLRAERQN